MQSTLMREIANGKVDGFPPKEELRTVYVEHDIDAESSDVSVVEYVLQDPILQGMPYTAHSRRTPDEGLFRVPSEAACQKRTCRVRRPDAVWIWCR